MGYWRLLPFAIVDGPTSAAVDEGLLETVGKGDSPPTLRFYTWSGSWLSVGSSQSVVEDVDLGACERSGVQIVRRASGGTAMLNEHLVGFSLVLPSSHPLVAGGITDTYRQIGPALIAGLEALAVSAQAATAPEVHAWEGSPTAAICRRACFARLAPSELLWQGRKLVGNAQVRRRGAVLLHGMLLLDFDAERMAGLLRAGSEAERAGLRRFLETRIGTLRQALGPRTPSWWQAAGALEHGFR